MRKILDTPPCRKCENLFDMQGLDCTLKGPLHILLCHLYLCKSTSTSVKTLPVNPRGF